VLSAFGLALVGAIAALNLQDGLGFIFQGCYFVGAAGAVCAVKRRSLFGPMVQPPLILALTVPAVVLLGSDLPAGSDTLEKALAVSTPLINGFPTMAITTGVTLLIGVVRFLRERDPDAPPKKGRGAKKDSAAKKESDTRKESGPKRDATPRKDVRQARSGAAPAAPARGRRTDDRRTDPDAARPRKPVEGRTGERRGTGRRVPPEERPRRGRDEGDPRARGRGGEPGKRPRPPGDGPPPERRRRDGAPPPERNPKAPRRRPPPDDRTGGSDPRRRGPERKRTDPPGGRQPRERPWDSDRG